MLISIFCQVIDNFGDIGVCWRLAKNLTSSAQINLYVDCLISFAKIANINVNLNYQHINNVNIIFWNKNYFYDEANCVINAFACKLPSHYQEQMPINIKWIQLDYLATEAWADEFNNLSAMLGSHKRLFLTSGFTYKTAGLLVNDFKKLSSIQKKEYKQKFKLNQKYFNIFIFAYINQSMFKALISLINIKIIHNKIIRIYMPHSVYTNLLKCFPKDKQFFISIICIDFYFQQEFDNLLQCFDFLWLRGEDSFIRGQLSLVPMVWQAYIQDENAHFDKLSGFLNNYLIYFKHNISQQNIKNLWHAINGIKSIHTNDWQQYFIGINQSQFQAGIYAWQQHLYQLPKLEQTIINYIKC